MDAQYVYQLISLVLLVLVVIFVFVIPDRRSKKQLRENVGRLQKGDTVFTKHGLTGRVAELRENTVIIEAEPQGVRLEIAKWGISQVNPQPRGKTGQ